MKYLFKTFWLCLIVISHTTTLIGQKKAASIWATANFNKETVMVGEPLVVTITIYTSTWFTDPPEFEEVQVSGAIMVRLAKNGAKTVTIGKKKFPAIEQSYVVYPSIIGENILPSFDIKVSCPPEGDFKGVERIVSTKERNFTVLPPPEGVDTSKWLSSYGVTLTDTWDRPLENLKAGDVIERRIRIKANGTLAALIQPIDTPQIDFGSVYPKTPILGNVQNLGSFTGSRTEIITFLIEEDGTFSLPEVVVPWFNLRTKKLTEEKLPAVEFNVAPNPDLEFILSRQKELQEELANEETEEIVEEEPFEFLGLNWWQLLLVILALSAIVTQLVGLIKKLQLKMKEKKEIELASEEHYFQVLEEACKGGDSKTIIRQLFFWYDRFRGTEYRPEIEDFVDRTHNEALADQLGNTAVSVYKEEKWSTKIVGNEELIKNLSEARKNNENNKKKKEEDKWFDLNPH